MLEYNEIIKSYVMTNVMFFKNIQLHHLFSSFHIPIDILLQRQQIRLHGCNLQWI